MVDELNDPAGLPEADVESDVFLLLADPNNFTDPAAMLSWNWADFHLHILSPYLPLTLPPVVILPEKSEFVYPIHDANARLSTSKASEMFESGKSMCKMYYTIEKMIALFMERLKEKEGITKETEVQIAFEGHELAQRKAFESIINLTYNVVITNFDPGPWGETYLKNARTLAEKGYGYPTEAPRDTYKQVLVETRGPR